MGQHGSIITSSEGYKGLAGSGMMIQSNNLQTIRKEHEKYLAFYKYLRAKQAFLVQISQILNFLVL